jgi:broad specificity phosphatase PhoE
MIYVIKHGQTDWDKDKRLQGSQDIPLNERGLQQAKMIGMQLSNVEFHLVFCSPMARAKLTAEAINAGEINIDDKLRERCSGDFEGLERQKHLFDSFLWSTRINYAQKNVEPMKDFEKRVFSFLDWIIPQVMKHPEINVLIVTHGGVIRVIKGYFRGRPKDGDYLYAFGFENNLAITMFQEVKRKDEDHPKNDPAPAKPEPVKTQEDVSEADDDHKTETDEDAENPDPESESPDAPNPDTPIADDTKADNSSE